MLPDESEFLKQFEQAHMYAQMFQNMNSDPSKPEAPHFFDDDILTPEFKMLKAAIPYFPQPQQRNMAVLIKFLELKAVINQYFKPAPGGIAMDANKILSSEAFQAIDEAQRQAYADLAQKLNGKTTAEAMPIVMAFIGTMPKGKPLSKAEQQAMLAVLMENMTEGEKTKFSGIMRML